MRIYNAGGDELSEFDLSYIPEGKFEWVVYSYQNGCYDGYGAAVGLRKEDGLLEQVSLDHCSCYGPCDSFMSGGKGMTVEEFFAPVGNIFDDDFSSLHGMVRRLLYGGALPDDDPKTFSEGL